MDENTIKNTQTDSGITLPLIWHDEDKDELLESTFTHSSETVRKDSKTDFLLTAVGIFAIICFAIMLYQCIRYNQLTFLNIVCFICYAVIAVIFIPKPMQCMLSSIGWKINLSKFAALGKAAEAVLHEDKAEFCINKKTVNVSYKYMEAIFETDGYFVLMVESRRILTFCKRDLDDEQTDKVREILKPYMSEYTETENKQHKSVNNEANAGISSDEKTE